MAIMLKMPLGAVSDADLARVSRENPGFRFGREEDGSIIARRTHTKGGAKSGEAFGQLRDYKKITGGNAYDSSTGFAIGPGKRVYSPDADWISRRRIDEPARAGGDKKYWPLAPDIVSMSNRTRTTSPSPSGLCCASATTACNARWALRTRSRGAADEGPKRFPTARGAPNGATAGRT